MRLQSLHPTLTQFRFGGWSLGRDLEHLERVREVGAPEAVVFYCSRVLEQLTGAAVEATTPERAATVFSNLRHLKSANILPPAHLVYFHTLRILGNAARHIHREVSEEDAEVAAMLLERVLSWFFVSLKSGPQLASLRVVEPELESATPTPLTQVLCLFEKDPTDLEEVQRLWDGGRGKGFLKTPIVSSLYAETLIRGEQELRPQAFRVLSSALLHFPADLRLRQLYGWLLRMEGKVEDALDILEGLYGEQPNDQETLGLLAGTYKRLWYNLRDSQSRKARFYLQEAQKLYNRSWKVSKKKDTYTGINAASTNLFSGKVDKARQLAGEIVSLFEKREQRRLEIQRQTGRVVSSFVDYWDEVTLAEAYVLLGQLEKGKQAYLTAFLHHADKPTWQESTRFQLQQILEALGLEENVDSFLRCSSIEPLETISTSSSVSSSL